MTNVYVWELALGDWHRDFDVGGLLSTSEVNETFGKDGDDDEFL